MLRAEIILLAGRLLKAADTAEFEKLVADFQALYNKLAAWEYLNQADLLPGTAASWERLFDHKESEKKQETAQETKETEQVPENNPLPENKSSEENIISKHEDLYRRSVRSHFKDKQAGTEPAPSKPETPAHSGAKLKIGLADKIALLNNLFDKQPDLFDTFLDEVGRAPTYDNALEIVGRYREQLDWTGKDEYEFRLIQLIQAKFA